MSRAEGRFALVFMVDPPSAEVFKKTELGNCKVFQVGETCAVKRPSWDQCQGKIISIGTKRDLMNLKVNTGGTLTLDQTLAVRNRFQEILKRKKEASLSARDKTLQDIAGNIVADGGPDRLLVTAGHHNSARLPKHRPGVDELKHALAALPCLQEPPDELKEYYTALGGEKVWIKTSSILLEQALHPNHPQSLFIGLLERLIPQHILSNPALSVCGTRGTAKFPESILGAVNIAVLSFFKQKQVVVQFSVTQLLRNFLYNKSHPKCKRPRVHDIQPEECTVTRASGSTDGYSSESSFEAITGSSMETSAGSSPEITGAVSSFQTRAGLSLETTDAVSSSAGLSHMITGAVSSLETSAGPSNMTTGAVSSFETSAGPSNMTTGAVSSFETSAGPSNMTTGAVSSFQTSAGPSNMTTGAVSSFQTSAGPSNMTTGAVSSFQTSAGPSNMTTGAVSSFQTSAGPSNMTTGAVSSLETSGVLSHKKTSAVSSLQTSAGLNFKARPMPSRELRTVPGLETAAITSLQTSAGSRFGARSVFSCEANNGPIDGQWHPIDDVEPLLPQAPCASLVVNYDGFQLQPSRATDPDLTPLKRLI